MDRYEVIDSIMEALNNILPDLKADIFSEWEAWSESNGWRLEKDGEEISIIIR